MTLVRAILAELRSMFLADARLTLGVLGVVAFAAILAALDLTRAAGAALVLGCLAVQVGAVLRAGPRRRRTPRPAPPPDASGG